ncbi:MAG: isoprenylcysteine carboxylmethyltransferase family protein [Planctomycetes bacterium]|nr:isoprenylcysteine carboxylmethyltransferase family protein [Planctomycetota bacterium]
MPASKKPTLRRIAVYLAGALVFVLARPTIELYAVGCGLALAGEALRLWACGHLRKNQAVIQSGPYSHVKNPLYLGTFLILVGGIFAASNFDKGGTSRYLLILFLPFALGVFFFYYLPHKFRVEGGRLRRRFGAEWDAYDQKVPDFIPSPWPRLRAPGRFDPALVAHNSEISTALLVLLGLAILGSKFFLPSW